MLGCGSLVEIDHTKNLSVFRPFIWPPQQQHIISNGLMCNAVNKLLNRVYNCGKKHTHNPIEIYIIIHLPSRVAYEASRFIRFHLFPSRFDYCLISPSFIDRCIFFFITLGPSIRLHNVWGTKAYPAYKSKTLPKKPSLAMFYRWCCRLHFMLIQRTQIIHHFEKYLFRARSRPPYSIRRMNISLYAINNEHMWKWRFHNHTFATSEFNRCFLLVSRHCK